MASSSRPLARFGIMLAARRRESGGRSSRSAAAAARAASAPTSPTMPSSTRRTAADRFRPDVDLRDPRLSLRIELPVGKVGAEHQQRVAGSSWRNSPRRSRSARSCRRRRGCPIRHAPCRAWRGRSGLSGFRQSCINSSCAAGATAAAQQRHALCLVEQIRQLVELRSAAARRWAPPAASPRGSGLAAFAAGLSATSPGITMTQTPRSATARGSRSPARAASARGWRRARNSWLHSRNKLLGMGFLEDSPSRSRPRECARRSRRTGTRERWQSNRPLMRCRLPGPQLPAQTASSPVRCASAPAAKAATSSWRTCSHSIAAMAPQRSR